MKQKIKTINYIFVFSLVLIPILFTTCKRSTPDKRSPAINLATPFSPSGFTTTLKLSTNPSTVNTGAAIQTVTVAATLTKIGSPLNNKTIIFDISDEFGNKIEFGSFEDGVVDVPIIEKVTNESGVTSVTYNTPLSSELLADTVIFIRAIVEGEGDESISDRAPIQLIGPSVQEAITVTAGDITLFANIGVNDFTTITATLRDQNGVMAGWNLLFEMYDASGNRVSIGSIDSLPSTILTTAVDGTAAVTYEAPLSAELPDLGVGETTTVYIRATLIWLGQEISSGSVRIIIEKL